MQPALVGHSRGKAGALLAVAAALILAALVAVGCGSGSDGETSGSATIGEERNQEQNEGNTIEDGGNGASADDAQASPDEEPDGSPTKASYIEQGDEICQDIPFRFQSQLQKLSQAQQEDAKQVALKAALPPQRWAIKQLKALGAPEGDEAEAEAIIAALEKAADDLEREPTREISGPKSFLVDFNKLTQEYGFRTCSRL